MKIGFIGLGKMGSNMVLNLVSKNHEVVVYNRSVEKVKKIVSYGAIGTYSLYDMARKLPKEKIIILMITAGKPVDIVLKQLLPLLSKDDVIIEAGNSYFEDSIRRSKFCMRHGIHFLDMGTSGGLIGARTGASLTIGGNKNAFLRIEKLFRDLAIKDGYAYMGKSGAGHFVKTVHNGIEYALLEAYGEGFEVLHKSRYKLDYEKVARVWSHGSVIRSWLTELAQQAFKKDPKLEKTKGIIGGGETGRWTLRIAKSENAEMRTLAHAIAKRKESAKKQSFSTKFVAALRNEFGGHVEPK